MVQSAANGLRLRTFGRGRGAGNGLSIRTAGRNWWSTGISAVYVLKTYQWRAVVVNWVDAADTQEIFIVNDYEQLFRDPVANGVYKTVSTDLLQQGWVDRENLIFWWEKKWYSDGTNSEAPVYGSQNDVFGSLLNIIQVLQLNTPTSLSGSFIYGTRGYENLVYATANTSKANFDAKDTTLLELLNTNGSANINNVVSYGLSSYQWRAVVVDWEKTSPLQLIFIINDYEKFFKDPLNNGVYKHVSTTQLTDNEIDRNGLIFWWEKKWINDGSTVEYPIYGSSKEVFGSLTDIITLLKSSAP